MELKTKKVLVTSGAGYIGSVLTRLLLINDNELYDGLMEANITLTENYYKNIV